MTNAMQEVEESFTDSAISRVALGNNGTVMGWIGARSQYNGHVWELHPLVVHADHRNMGVGRALMADIEEQV
jgi:aminoglycoside 6'-N-acetyltransferase I